ncbi:hypothetical protein DMUE_2574 [Dictyocoela muelleri]|nr:hypothetical protein DMUE_2574 [Dictyocoela muelleri]
MYKKKQREMLKYFLKNDYSSLNDLNCCEFEDYKQKYYIDNFNIISTYVTFIERAKLNRNGIFRYVYYENPFIRPNINLNRTRFKLGNKPMMVPEDILAVAEAMGRKDLKTKGIFRKSVAITVLNKAKEILIDLISKKYDIEYVIQQLQEFDIITLACLLKAVFDFYDYKIFPENYIEIMKNINNSNNKDHKKIILKYLFLALPKENRVTLEFLSVFQRWIYFISTDSGKDRVERLDIYGMCVVFAPKLFDQKNVLLYPEDFQILAEMLDFIINNYTNIFLIEANNNYS